MKSLSLTTWNELGCALLLLSTLLLHSYAQELADLPTSLLQSQVKTNLISDVESHYIQTNLPYIQAEVSGSYPILRQFPRGVKIPEEIYAGQASTLRLGASTPPPTPPFQHNMPTLPAGSNLAYIDQTGRLLDSNLLEVGKIDANGSIIQSGPRIFDGNPEDGGDNPDDGGDPEEPIAPPPIPPCGTCMPSSDYNYSAAISQVDLERFQDLIGSITSEYRILSDLRTSDGKLVAANAFVAEAYLQAGFTFWPVTHAGYPATSSDWRQHFSDWGFEEISPAAPKEGAIIVIDKLMGIYHVDDDGDGFLVHPSDNNDGKIVTTPWSLLEGNTETLVLYPKNFAVPNN